LFRGSRFLVPPARFWRSRNRSAARSRGFADFLGIVDLVGETPQEIVVYD
jgi:hypothetical protein